MTRAGALAWCASVGVASVGSASLRGFVGHALAGRPDAIHLTHAIVSGHDRIFSEEGGSPSTVRCEAQETICFRSVVIS
jgi:hypothetical protein